MVVKYSRSSLCLMIRATSMILKKGTTHADIAIFDAETVGSPKRPEMRHDLPGGGRRLVVPARGVMHTVVNGQVLYEDQQHNGAMPGQVLRAG